MTIEGIAHQHERHVMTLDALADVDADRTIDCRAVQAWPNSLATDGERLAGVHARHGRSEPDYADPVEVEAFFARYRGLAEGAPTALTNAPCPI